MKSNKSLNKFEQEKLRGAITLSTGVLIGITKTPVEKYIKELLTDIEKDENVIILYACESGSRAWGFPSSDSDYDVRFLYIRPIEWYLSIEEGRDVIELINSPFTNELFDLRGWDIKKALKLYKKSNPPLLEWLHSPIIYLEKDDVAQQMRKLLPEFYSPLSCLFHYLHMAKKNFREYLKGDKVWIKKYFYILRPVLACKWIEKDLGPVPMEFQILVDRIIESDGLKTVIKELIKRKKEGEELSWGSKIPEINNFLDEEIKRLDAKRYHITKLEANNYYNKKYNSPVKKLNNLFFDMFDDYFDTGM